MKAAAGGSISRDHLVLGLIAAAAIVMVGYPVVFVLLRSVSADEIGGRLTLEWIGELFQSSRSHEALINTAIYTAGSSMLAMVLGVGLAFLSTRTDMLGGWLVGVLAMLPILVPPFILVVGWVALADPNAGLVNVAASRL